MSEAATLARDTASGMLGGVCAGLGRRLGVDPLLVRALFVIASVAGGAGVAVYVLAWAVLPEAPGAGAAGRRHRLSAADPRSLQVAAGIGLLVLAALLVFRAWGFWVGDGLVWPVVLVASGAALVWRQSQGQGEPEAVVPDGSAGGRERRGVGLSARLGASARGGVVLGALLVVGGGLVFLWLNDALRPARDVLLAVVVVVAAAALILAPWWLRLVRGLSAERAERIRS